MLKRITRFIVLLLLPILLISGVAYSQSGGSGSGLGIAPTRSELSIGPGDKDVITISLRNVTDNTIIAKPVVNDFTSDNDTGRPQLIVNEERSDLPSIRPFLKNLTDVTLKKGENKSFQIKVQIPKDTAPGGYYGILRYIAVPEGSQSPDPGQVSLTASVSTIVLIEVPGTINEQIQFKNVLVYRSNVPGSFFSSPPNEIGTQIVNQGNGFVKPFGTVVVNDPFGKELQSYEINTGNPRSNVLPYSTRTFRNNLADIKLPGRYSITAAVSFGNGGEVLTMNRTFWYLPIWSILLLVLVIVLVVRIVKSIHDRYYSKNKKSHL